MAPSKAKKIYVQETTITELPIKINRLETIKTYTQHGLIIKEEKTEISCQFSTSYKVGWKRFHEPRPKLTLPWQENIKNKEKRGDSNLA